MPAPETPTAPAGTGPLSGTVVLELTTHVAGPICGKLLAEYGAEVIKIEPPGAGDPARHWGPFPDDVPDPEASGLFLYANTAKKGVALDLKQEAGRTAFLRLVARADIVLENFSPRVMPSLGLGWDVLREVNPGLVFTSVSSFGQTGPYRDYRATELTMYAMGGSMWATGLPDREPQILGPYVVEAQAGYVAAGATAAARYRQLLGGPGQHVDVSIMETAAGSIDRGGTALLCIAYSGTPSYFRAATQRMFLMPTGVFPCADGYVSFLTYVPTWWPRFCHMIDRRDLVDDPRYSTPEGVYNVAEYQEEIDVILYEWLLTHTRQEIETRGQAAGMAVTRVNTVADLLTDEHLRARNFWHYIDHPVAGTLAVPGAPAQFREGAWRTGRAPLLGEHTDDVLAGLVGDSDQDPPDPRGGSGRRASSRSPGPATDPLPLAAVRVIDLTIGGSGPFGTMMITDLGAEVIRIDDVRNPDLNTRGAVSVPIEAMAGAMGAHYPDRRPGARPYERYTMFNYTGRGRKSATFALGDPRTLALLLKLIGLSDVLICNRAAGTLARLGLAPDELMAANPRLIVVEMTGFGATPGPYRDYRGYGANMEAIAGHTSMRGYPDLDLSNVTTVVHGDAVGGAAGLFAVTAALVQRERTGRGDYVDLSQTEAIIPQLAPAIADYTMNGRVAGPAGNRDAVAVQGVYRCAGEDNWLALSVLCDADWESLCRAIGRPGLIQDDRFATALARRAHHDEFDQVMRQWSADRDHYQAFHTLQAAGIAAAPVLTMKEAFADPHHRARGFFEPITYPCTGPTVDGKDRPGTHDYAGPIFDMSVTPIRTRGPAPSVGQHNEYVYRGLLGLDDLTYDGLVRDGLIGDGYPGPSRSR